jgi:hypothetical protein
MLPTDPLTLAIWPSIASLISVASSEVKGCLRSILLYNLNSTCSILIKSTYFVGDMSAGSLAKAISKSGSSLPTRYSRPSISSSSIRALKLS